MEVELKALPARAVLESSWRTLEARSDAAFFTSWSWIGSWLHALPPELEPRLLVATHGGRTVGMGVVVQHRSRLLRAIPIKSWWLHTTGSHKLDDLVIEYNGFLLDRDVARLTRDAMLTHLLCHTGVNRVEINQAERAYGDLAHSKPKGTMVSSRFKESYLVDLARVRTAQGGYPALLSGNTRSQWRRSVQAYEQAYGKLQLDVATDLDQARTYFDAMRQLHLHTWRTRGKATSFGSSTFAFHFHQSLIDHAFSRGEVQIVRVTAGTEVIGYLYNFVHRGRVYFYQCGFHYGLLDKHDRPGLVCHALAIAHNAQAGLALYDFMAGDYRYKASLATHTEPQGSHVVQRASWLARMDEALRTAQAAARQWRREGRMMFNESEIAIATTLIELLDWMDVPSNALGLIG